MLKVISVVGLFVGAVLLTACSPAVPVAGPTRTAATATGSAPESTPVQTPVPTESAHQTFYEESVAEFPFALPEGYGWPELAPKSSLHGGPANDDAARELWGCSVIHAAWGAAAEGDLTEADRLIAQLDQDSRDWDLAGHGGSTWDPRGRNVGDNYMCITWFRLNDLPMSYII